MIITIDGPAASGKSSVAQEVAQQQQLFYVNTGYLYRALAYQLVVSGALKEEQIVAAHLVTLYQATQFDTLSYEFEDGRVSVFISSNDITPHLKSPAVDAAASLVGLNGEARNLIVEFVRRLVVTKSRSIIEGRDAGTIVFPFADLKIFLTASIEARAQRWLLMQAKAGVAVSLDQAIEALSQRDERDKTRAVAPLCVPVNAILLDNTYLTFEQTVKIITALIEDRS